MSLIKLAFVKTAAAQAPSGYTGVSHQQFLPVGERRELTETEQSNVAAGRQQWLPKIFKSYATPAHKLLASPGKSALLAGLAAGGVGGLYGGAAGHAISQGSGIGSAGGALAGAALAGIPAAALAYFARNAKNEDIEETMRRSRENPTYRDIQSDPLVQRNREVGANVHPLVTGLLAGGLLNR